MYVLDVVIQLTKVLKETTIFSNCILLIILEAMLDSDQSEFPW